MFRSFFPHPKVFFISAVLWAAAASLLWHLGAAGWATNLGFAAGGDGTPVIGVSRFWSGPFLWFDLYFAAAAGLFAAGWRLAAPHPWWRWSILGSALIIFSTYFGVEVSVAINDWYGPFYDMIQAALSKSGPVTPDAFYGAIGSFLAIALVAVTVGVLTRFFVSHYIFRWRAAMNDYYMANWDRLRLIEGASQRVQEDTMRFSSTMETLGVSLITAVMTLIAFLPVLLQLSSHITVLPIIGEVPAPLVTVALIWSAFGTTFLALVGIRLPGLEFRNQRVEAAYRKELVYGEDHAEAASPPTVRDLFSDVRHNYFRLYIHYTYFNIARILYLQADTIIPYLVLGPTILAGAITLGIMNQVLNAFEQVRTSFQYLVNSWTTIVELLSITKRLAAFEAAIGGDPLPPIEATDRGRRDHGIAPERPWRLRTDAGSVPSVPIVVRSSAPCDPRVEPVAQRIAEEVERERDDEDRRAREDRRPGRELQEGAPFRQHHAERRRRRLGAEAEERQRRLDEDRRGQQQAELDEHDAQEVRQDMDRDDARVRGADRTGVEDIVACGDHQRRAAQEAREDRRVDDRDRCRGRECAGAEQRDHPDREQHHREREQDVHRAHDDALRPAAEVRRDEAERPAREERGGHRGRRDRQRGPQAVDDPRQDVPPELIGPERVGGRGSLQPRQHVDRDRAVGRDERREDRDDHEDEEHAAGDAEERRAQSWRRTTARGGRIRRKDRVDGRHRAMRGSISPYTTSTRKLTTTKLTVTSRMAACSSG